MTADKPKSPALKPVCQNRKATFSYFIDERIEAGLVLTGTEIKCLRQGKGSLAEAYANVKDGQAWIFQFHIPPYEQGNINNVDPVRPRKLLMHRREIERLAEHVARQGFALVPMRVYLRNGIAKLELGLGRGKKLFDKRETLKERDHTREMQRASRRDRWS